MDGPRVKVGQRVVLGVLTENDHHNRNNQVRLIFISSALSPLQLTDSL